MLTLTNLSYIHPNGDLVFDALNIAINKHDKAALVGNNGTGKSTLLKIMAGQLLPSVGAVRADAKTYYVPQHVGQFNYLTVAQALNVNEQLSALKEIINGNVTEQNLSVVNDDWLLEERCNAALAEWKLEGLDLGRTMETLSGGQKTKVFLAGISLHQPQIVLLDEPSNHLDTPARNILYNYISTTAVTLIVVSHDKTLLNLVHTVYELSNRGITTFGGDYDFYVGQKKNEQAKQVVDVKYREKALRKAKAIERESLERRRKLDARGKKKQQKAGLPTISMNTFKNKAEKSTSRIKDVHAEKVETIAQELNEIRRKLSVTSSMKLDLDNAMLHLGKKLLQATDINVEYNMGLLWKVPLSFLITSGERIAIKGLNGSGKTTLIKIIRDEQPHIGTLYRAPFTSVYIDQDYALIDNICTVYEQAQKFNDGVLSEEEVKIRLNRFLFSKGHWDKSCDALSGGEKMRLMLCCLMVGNQAPDMIIVDEPTNNLDIQNIEILTAALREYSGTLIVVSHDDYFLEHVKVERVISLG